MNKKLSLYVAAATIVSAGFVSQAFAAGYEKSIMWGGRSAGVAGIATPYIQGSEALYFNPAGLVSDKVGQDVSLNISPTTDQFTAPFQTSASGTSQASSNHAMTYPSGLIYGSNYGDRWGFGVGGYASAGNEANYAGAGTALGPVDVKTSLQVYELALGGSYKVSDRLKVGLAYRIVMANAAISTVSPIGGTQYQVNATSLKDTQYNGFKLGAQYKLDDKTLLGLTYRSEVNFKAKGNVQAYPVTSGAAGAAAAPTGSATVETTLPMQVTIGSEHDYNETWKSLFEVAWTQYSRIKTLAINTTGITQNWNDQYNVRLGAEYHGWMLPARFGYGWTNQVTNSSYARPTFTPPAMAHTLTAGTGYSVAVFGSPLQLDGAVEETFASGNSKNEAAGVTPGKYSVNEIALHLGAVYAF